MSPWLVRNVLYPTHEWFVGRQTIRCYRELGKTQWLLQEQLRELQQNKLRQLLTHAWDRCPGQRDRLQAAGLERPALTEFSLDDLPALPLLERTNIQDDLERLTDKQVAGGAFRYTTGGSTGVPLIFYYDRRRQAYDQAARMRTHAWFGVRPGEKEIYLWGAAVELSRQDRLKTLRDRLTNQLLLSAFNMSPETMRRYVEIIRRYRPACLFGYPSSLSLLAESIRDSGCEARWPGLKAVFVSGEVLYPHQRALLQQTFAVPVADCYGSRDAGFVAHECPAGRMHVTAENVIVEILRDDGRASEAGESGELVVTHLDNYALPLIRYRTGDRGKLAAGRCSCGRELPLMEVIEGRSTDFLIRADGAAVHALALIYTLRELPGVRQFKIHQSSLNHVAVRVVRTPVYATTCEGEIRRQFRQRLGEGVEVDIDYVDSIPLERSGKYRYVSSDLTARRRVETAEAV